MKMRFSFLLCACLCAFDANAAGLGEPEANVPQRLVESSLNKEVAASDPRVAKTREQLLQAMKATGESEPAVAQHCMRNARYMFDVTKVKVSPLEVLEAVARFAPPGQPINLTTQRYVDLRVKEKLDHSGALAKMAAGK